jgi:membrane-associated phospholipid phosphatase
MSAQIALPLVVLAFSHRLREVRVYLLAFAIALALTAIVATLLPAASPIAWIDRAAFSNLHFVGATPLNHLWLLRQPGPLVISRSLGGIVAFPSFHASIAIMAPVALRRYPRLLAGLLVFEVAMFGGTITEGAHYVSDVLAGGFVALLAYALAQRLVQAESGGAAP